MEKKELAERIVEYASNYHWNLEGWGDNVPEDDDLEKELTGIVTFVFEELDKAREEGKRMVYEAIVYDENIPHEVTTFVAANLWKNMRDKAKEELSKLKE